METWDGKKRVIHMGVKEIEDVLSRRMLFIGKWAVLRSP